MMRPLAALVCAASMCAGAQAFSGESVSRYPLHAVAGQGDAAAIGRLLAKGAPIEARDASGSTALLVATRANQVDAARELVDAGADVNAKDRIGDSPYLYAGVAGHLEILKLTLAHGADLRSTNRYGGTALIPAAERGHVDTVLTLVEASVVVDHVNRLGWTALLEAIILGNGGERHQRIVNILLGAGADPDIADREGVTPLQHARARGYREIERALLSAGAH